MRDIKSVGESIFVVKVEIFSGAVFSVTCVLSLGQYGVPVNCFCSVFSLISENTTYCPLMVVWPRALGLIANYVLLIQHDFYIDCVTEIKL